ncbi:CAP domain-containing protein [Rhodococcus sp. IEGM 1408]|nr:CAP domain-containing protein [Rhodococcus sp. IEGM 1408]
MRSRLVASLATIAVTSATLMGGGAATASAQALPSFIPQNVIPQHVVDGLLSQARAAVPAEVWAAAGSTEMGYQNVSGGLRDGIIREIDSYRVAKGLGTLAPNAGLDAEAQTWADRLAAEDAVYHNTALLSRGHGENIVAAGTHCGAVCLVDLWKNSPGHNDNLVDPGYRSAGMGIAYSAGGKVFVVHDFAY